MALFLFIALLALPGPSIHAKLTRREHARDRLLNMDRVKATTSPPGTGGPLVWILAAAKRMRNTSDRNLSRRAEASPRTADVSISAITGESARHPNVSRQLDHKQRIGDPAEAATGLSSRSVVAAALDLTRDIRRYDRPSGCQDGRLMARLTG